MTRRPFSPSELTMNLIQRLTTVFLILIPLIACGGPLFGESVTLTPILDNTLYEFDPEDPSNRLNSNGSGDFFSAGRSQSRSQLRRGLLLFDFSEIPAGVTVVPGSSYLDLYVVDVPRKDPSPRPFWLVPAPDQEWGEGASAMSAGVSGAGSGAQAEVGDATWWHTSYDPVLHDGVPFVPGGQGFWSEVGALGADPLDSYTLYGEPAAVIPSEQGAVRLVADSLEADLRAWLQGDRNSGWMLLGDELVEGDDESSLRGFASREHLTADFRPQLHFEYTTILPGDFDGNGWLDEADITLLTSATQAGTDPSYDLNGDGMLDFEDRRVWVEELKYTWFGDTNLNGHFGTGDITAVFQIGEYEDALPGNSTWSEGDWSGDFDFDSSDFVIAFQGGGYGQGPRRNVLAVPEPATGWGFAVALLMLWFRSKRPLPNCQRGS